MVGSKLAYLRDLINMPRSELASLLDIGQRTLINWESNDNVIIARPYILAVRKIFETKLLRDKIIVLSEKIFKLMPAEYVAVWIVNGNKVKLLENSTYHIAQDGKPTNSNVGLENEISSNSLTCKPLRDGHVINMTNKEIQNDAHHVNHSFCGHLKSGECFNALKIPILGYTPNGFRPALLASLENRLSLSGKNWQLDSKNYNEAFPENKIEELKLLIKDYYDKKLSEIFTALDFFTAIYE